LQLKGSTIYEGSGGRIILSRINFTSVFSLLLVAGVACAIIKFVDFSPSDPLEVHRALIRKKTLKLINDSASPDWTSKQLRYVIIRFDDREDPKLACCKIAYEIVKGEIRTTKQIRMTMVKGVKEGTENEPYWEFSEIAIPDSPSVSMMLYELLMKDVAPTESKMGRKKKKVEPPPRQPHHCDSLPGNWNTYRWIAFDPEKHIGGVQGLAPKDWLKVD